MFSALADAVADAVDFPIIARVNERLRTLMACVRVDTTGNGAAFMPGDRMPDKPEGEGGPYLVMKPILRGDVAQRLAIRAEREPPPVREIAVPETGRNTFVYRAVSGLDALLVLPDIRVPARRPYPTGTSRDSL